MKRILSIILCLAMLSAGFGAFAEDTSADLIGTEAQSALGMLNALGVFKEYSSIKTIDKDKEITRAEFADSLAKILKLNEVGETLYYHDVSKEHFAYKAITALTASGHLQGNGTGMFFPDEIITLNEAQKIIVSVLGYGKETEAGGKNLGAYLKIASRLKLNKNCTGSSKLDFEDMLILFKNSIIAPMYGFEPDGNDIKYMQDDSKTILSVYYDCYYRENERLTAANAVSIYGNTVKGTDIIIGDNEFETPAEDMSEYLGSYVNYIYSGELNVDDNAVIWLEKNKKNDEIVVCGKQNIDKFDSDSYKFSYYDENERLCSVRIEKNASVIYNGGFVDDLEAAFDMPYTSVRLVADKSGGYDLCMLYNYENHVVEYVNFEDEYIKGRGETDNISTNPDDFEFILIRNAKNEPFLAEEFAEDMIASVYLSLDGKYIKIVVSEEKINGEVIGKGTDTDGRSYIDIADGGRIYLHGDLSADGISPGDNIALYIDAEGEAAYFKLTPAGDVYSFILKAYTDDEGFYVKAFTQAGSVEKFKAAEKFKIDGETCRGSDAAESLDEVIRLLKEKVAVIEFNNAGEIKSIDTPEGKGKLRLDVPSARNSWLNSSSKLGKKLMIDDGTVIITIPKDFQTANEEEFGIISKKNLKHWGSYLAESYKVSDDDSYADLVVMRDYSKFIASSEDVPLVVSSVSEGVNPDNEVVTQIEGYIGNALMTYMCDSGYIPENIKVGDILSISTNSKGMVTKTDKIAGADSAVGESTSYLADNSRVVAGFVNSVDGKIVKVSMQDGSTVDEYFDMSTPVIVCTPGKKTPVEVGSGADIKAFTHYGAKCSKIVVRTYQQIQKVMVIYNNQ